MAEPARWHDRLELRLALAALLGLLVGVLALLSSLAAHPRPRPELCIGISVVAVVLIQCVRETAGEPAPAEWQPESPPADSAAYLARLRQLERRLEGASRDGAKYDRNVRPVLVRLATERLRQKYGIDPRRQPARAREVLGDQLWLLMSAPTPQAGPAPSRAQLSALVEAIQAL